MAVEPWKSGGGVGGRGMLAYGYHWYVKVKIQRTCMALMKNTFNFTIPMSGQGQTYALATKEME